MLLAFIALNSNASTVSNLIDSATATTKSVITSTANGVTDAVHYTDTSSNFRLLIQKGESMVIFLAESFKTSAKYVLHIIGKKYFLMGIYAWLAVLGGIILLFFGISRFYKLDFKKLTDDDTPLSVVYFFTGLTGLLFGVFLITNNLQDAINYTFNPEYYVLQEVIDMVKTLKQ